MSVTLDLSGLDARLRQIKSLANLDATPLMETWKDIIEEDNRSGILAGLDKDGVPMIPVKYRPKEPPGQRVTKPPKPGKKNEYLRQSLKQFRLGQKAGLRKGKFAGMGPAISGINNNLSTSEYQLLGGPPLAPRDQFSRVITNLETGYGRTSGNNPEWFAEGRWDEVVSIKGVPFLRYHFEGTSKLPRRDLRGVRPSGVQKALAALKTWARLAVREHFDK